MAIQELEIKSAERSFSSSIIITGIRCMISYVIIPFVTPLLSLSSRVGPVVGIMIGLVALAANIYSIKRFWTSRHRFRKPITVLHLAVIVLLLVLLFRDVGQLV